MDIKKIVRDSYANLARKGTCCCGASRSDNAPSNPLGYDEADLATLPDGVDMGLGCGNPTAIANLMPGEVVLDLGCGAGIDCFLAAKYVGPTGYVIGVDMTPEMIEKARANAAAGGYTNVEFRLGEIENLPVESESVDVVISNCVINLVPDKARAFAEVYRVLRPGGRLHVSDIVLDGKLPDELRQSLDAYVACIAGAAARDVYLSAIKAAGLRDIVLESEYDASELLSEACCSDPVASKITQKVRSAGIMLPKGLVTSITLSAHKPT